MSAPPALPVVVAVVAAFVLSGAWYALFGRALPRLSPAYTEPRPPAATAGVEAVRNLLLALVVWGLVSLTRVDSLPGGLGLGALLWLGFPVVLLAGSVFHERVPWRLAAVHAGDWLVKMLVVTALLAAWP
jgi:hypothetical protein